MRAPSLRRWQRGFVVNPYSFGSGPPAPFSPTDIVNLRLWLDASDASTITDSGGAVSAWTSKDGNGRTFTKGGTSVTTGSKTLNGENVLDLSAGYFASDDAASVWKFMHDGSDTSIFIVFRVAAVADPDDLYGLMGTNQAGAFSGMSLHWEDRSSLSRNETIVYSATNSTQTDYRVKETSQNLFWSPISWGVFEHYSDLNNATDTARSSMYRAGVEATSTPTANGNVDTASDPGHTLGIGATAANGSRPFTGQIAEVIVYEGQISSGDRTALREYLNAKWGIGQPGGVENARLWLDADDAESFLLSGSDVTLWADKSGHGRNGTQTSGTAQPTRQASVINSRAVVRFDGSTDVINVPSGIDLFRNVAGATVVAVAKTTSAASTMRIVHASVSGSNNNRVALVSVGGAMTFRVRRLDADSETFLSGGSVASDTAQLFRGEVDYTNRPGELFIDGASAASNATLVSAGSTSNTNGDNLNVGAHVASSQHWVGDIAEIILFDRVLSTDEADSLEAYLATKWGITI